MIPSQFINKSGIINSTSHLVADGVTADCKSNQIFGPTYNMGVMMGEFAAKGPGYELSKNVKKSRFSSNHKVCVKGEN